jgi:hypothetical protein
MRQKLREPWCSGPSPALPHPRPTPAASTTSPWWQPPPCAPSSKAPMAKFTVPAILPPQQGVKSRGPPEDEPNGPPAMTPNITDNDSSSHDHRAGLRGQRKPVTGRHEGPQTSPMTVERRQRRRRLNLIEPTDVPPPTQGTAPDSCTTPDSGRRPPTAQPSLPPAIGHLSRHKYLRTYM